ncbi:MAG: beta-lactamase [Peptococcaceae bacterium BICA1-7]|nr:MAG: beta-lactamase [Peptococcaceae bacterium BICA1-7]HBV96066.1 MBL fold metallo-hydrolase [Desulfotomaculum sp.]
MQIHVLASGSSGNSIYIAVGGVRILVDAGISARRMERSLAGIGVGAGELDALLITHEHSDHIKGLEVFSRKFKIPVYARPKAWEKIGFRDALPAEVRRELPGSLDIGTVRIEPFKISHDAADPVGFCFYHRHLKCAVATDLGVVTKPVEEALAYTDAVVLESNHDIDMLNNGPYPFFLKKRIRSDVGHLSNLDAARLLERVPRKGPMHVFLAHLSQQNNHPDLAENTVSGHLSCRGCEVGREIVLQRTYRDAVASYVREGSEGRLFFTG